MNTYVTPEEFRKLNEKERRLLIAGYAVDYGYGGIAEMSRRYHVARTTINRGIRELKTGTEEDPDRIRNKGGGRKRKDDTVYPDLDQKIMLLKDESPGISLRGIAEELYRRYDIQVSFMTVKRILQKYHQTDQSGEKR